MFNGDFVDRGNQGCEVLLVLLAFKVLHPKHVHLNRGNHEDVMLNQAYGFADEVRTEATPLCRAVLSVGMSC